MASIPDSLQIRSRFPAAAVELTIAIASEADRCVACGLCLPHCPTYRATRTENESPRGRIALMRALARGELALTPRLESHLDLCLTCRNCERVCPAKVRYGVLIDEARAYIEQTRPRPLMQRLLRALTMDWLIARPANLRWAAAALRFYQRSGLQLALRTSQLLKLLGLAHLDARLPPIPRQVRWRPTYRAARGARTTVGLFKGCIGETLDAPTLLAAIRVLNALGCDVVVPVNQTCCGALHQHGGEASKAATLMRGNLQAFATTKLDAIVSVASGCAAMLAEYGQWLADDARARELAAKTVDVSRFVAEYEWPSGVHLAPLAARVAVHDPCTLTNVLAGAHWPYKLLERIPQLQVLPLAENSSCCGAAGAYFLTQPQLAEQLRERKLEQLAALAPDMLLSSNIGCALHLADGLRTRGLDLEVLHPVTLIARQMREAVS